MSHAAGTRLGPYEIVAPLGAGGMGEVYRARDTRLNRSVALKVLAPSVAIDPDLRARFQREAQAIAALSHPHICALHDVGEHEGTAYLVMELLDGATLADRLASGPLPIAQALTVAAQIADALDRAHRVGIVHRDLKPANVMLTKAGAKLLDFGVAKLVPGQGAVAIAGPQAATTAPGTAAGTILGTIQYMAPEQVEGKAVDHRADIWALGAVMYEMVSGVRPFTGDSPASIVGAILKDTPAPLSARQPLAPLSLDRIVASCLEKDADDRWQSAGDLRRELQWAGDPAASQRSASPAPASRFSWRSLAVVGALAVLGGGVATGWRWVTVTSDARPPASVIRFQLTLPDGLTLVPEQPPAVSMDGSRLALVAVDRESGRRQIYLRPMNSLSAQAVSGTFDAQYPFWSPDGRRLAYFAGTRLRTVELDSGTTQDLAAAPNPGGPGVWMGAEIVYPRSSGPIARVPSAGGSGRPAAPFDAARETNQSLAGAFPDGSLLVTSQAGLFLVTADGRTSTLVSDKITMPATLLDAGNAADPRPVVAFIQNGRLMAQRLQPSASGLDAAEPVLLAADASVLVTQSARPFSVGADVLAFTSRSGVQTRPTWVGRDGAVLGPAASVTGQLRDLRLSPNGRMLSVSRLSEAGRFELLLVDLARNTVSTLARQLSFQQGAWTPDGRSIIGVAQSGPGGRAVVRVPAEEGAQAEVLVRPTNATPNAPQVSADGQYLCYTHTDNAGDFDVYIRRVAAGGEGTPLMNDSPYEASCRISPDGRWAAYHSNETGVLNVFLRSFPGGKEKQQVSLEGGQRPTWRADGKELFYLAPDGGLVAAAVSSAPTLTIGTRQRLFTAPVDPTFGTPGATLFDAVPSGDRFVMLVPTANVPQPVTVIANWRTLLSPQ